MKRKTLSAPLILVILFASALTISWAVIYQNLHIRSFGTVKTIGVEAYWEPELLNPVTEIDWEFVEPGTSKSVTIYIVCTSNVPTTLRMFIGTWEPEGIDTYISCSWGLDFYNISSETVQPAEIRLFVEQGIIEAGYEDFSFDILIEGSG